MSRIPRIQEHLKSGFTAEAVAAARCRAYATQAEREGLGELSQAWRELAKAKDHLAILQLEAAGQVRKEDANLAAAMAEERFENEVLYPKMIREVDDGTAALFRQVMEAQREHLRRLEELRRVLHARESAVQLPAEVAH